MGYGYLHSKLFGIEIGGINIGSYTTLLIPFSIVIIVGIYFLIKTRINLKNMSKTLNIISIVLLSVVIAYVGIQNVHSSQIENATNMELLFIPDTTKDDFPDIYYIILDEYAGAESLQKDFDFDNSKFYSALSDRDFYIVPKSYSNYPYTLLSIPSSLNMQYLDFLAEELGPESTDTRPIVDILQNNLVMKNLKANGYHIVSFYAGSTAEGSTHLVTEKLCGNEYYFNELQDLMIRFTPVSYFFDSPTHHDKRDEILCTFSEIPKVKSRTTQPIFVYAHIMIPHEPYVFDANGNTVRYSEITDRKEAYLQQLEFANKKTIETIDAISTISEKPPIIIIQSDHGERTGIDWENPTDDMIRRGFNNLNAYRLPGDGNSLYETITPVNSFRVIFNEYFDADFKLLKDRSYWVKSDDVPYDLRDVTEILDKYR